MEQSGGAVQLCHFPFMSTKSTEPQVDSELLNRLVEEEIHLRTYGNFYEGGQLQAKQKELDELWQQDRNTLAFLDSTLQSVDKLTTKMVCF